VSEKLDRMERMVGELQRRALDLRTTPLFRVLETLPRMAREIAQRAGKRVEVELRGAEIELDRSILDRLGEPLVHLVRNAVDHGIELPAERSAAGKPDTGRVLVDARRTKDRIQIDVLDDGRGIDVDAVRAKALAAGLLHPDLADDLPAAAIVDLVFHPGLSTAQEVSEVSGRGVGMDAVRATIESLGGAIEIETARGRGTRTTFTVPVTAAVQRVLLLGFGPETVALSIAKVERVLEVSASALERSGRESFALIDGAPVPVIDLAERLGFAPPPAREGVSLVLTEVRGETTALRVERVAGQQEIYVKPIPKLLAEVRALAGLTATGVGRPIFLLDLNQLA
jgi:two-component system chemotaxis sensor kinase CheA